LSYNDLNANKYEKSMATDFAEWCSLAGGVLWRVVFFGEWCSLASGVLWLVVYRGRKFKALLSWTEFMHPQALSL
jgi:hypothetical protein